MAFGDIKPKKIVIDQQEALHGLTKLYQSLDSEIGRDLLNAHLRYLSERNVLIKNHKNKYVHVTKDEIIRLERIESRPSTVGLLYLVGKEVQKTETAFFSNSIKVDSPILPIGYGFENHRTLWADGVGLVDTGCTTTTFDIKIYLAIINENPQYANATIPTGVQAVGSFNQIIENKMDIKFNNKVYKDHIVNFADINGNLLIGRDLINQGILQYESQKWISYSRH